MILFKPQHVPLILSGRKIETRRSWKSWRVKVGGIYRAKTRMLSRDHFATICVEKIWEERLGDISAESVHNEGYDSLEDFRKAYQDIYGLWDPDKVVKVIRFSAVEQG